MSWFKDEVEDWDLAGRGVEVLSNFGPAANFGIVENEDDDADFQEVKFDADSNLLYFSPSDNPELLIDPNQAQLEKLMAEAMKELNPEE